MPRKFVIYDRLNRPKLSYPENTKDYVDYQIHDIKKSTGPEADDFEIVQEVEEVKTNIDEFINSYKDEVGIENILRKIALTKDPTLLNQREEVHMDTTIIPEDPHEAFELSKSVEEKFAKIDKELTEGKSMEEFIKSLDEEKLNKYIERKVNEKLSKAK